MLRPFRPDMKHPKKRKRKIFKLKMKLANSRRSPEWTMDHLEAALSRLKSNKSRDSDGYINEIFKLKVIGDNLKKSLLIMFRNLKKKKLVWNLTSYIYCIKVRETIL